MRSSKKNNWLVNDAIKDVAFSVVLDTKLQCAIGATTIVNVMSTIRVLSRYELRKAEYFDIFEPWHVFDDVKVLLSQDGVT